MAVLELPGTQSSTERAPLPISEIDFALTAQIVVAWAGEGGEEPRLGWWRSDLASEFGGEDLFRRLFPHTWQWAVLQAAREAARRKDTELRAKAHDSDNVVSLFSLGFELDERLEERLQDLKRSGVPPRDALPSLNHGLQPVWSRDAFFDWIAGHGTPQTLTTPVGRRLKGAVPTTLDLSIRQLVSALVPPSDAYPLPHFRKDK